MTGLLVIRRAAAALGAALLFASAPAARAQVPDTLPPRPDSLAPRAGTLPPGGAGTAHLAPPPPPFWPGVLERSYLPLESLDEDRIRVMQLLGQAPLDGWLVRSATRRPAGAAREAVVEMVFPEMRAVWNSKVPYSLNDGAMWAGRGTSVAVSGGLSVRTGRLTLVVAPQLVWQQNADFDYLPQTQRRFSQYASPWHVGAAAIDLPSRFGDDPYWVADLGQSRVSLGVGPAEVGATAENLWWGPGIRNAIVMSGQAAGIPHLFLASRRPLRTPLGEVEGRWMVGGLTESAYYDTVSTNRTRALSGIALTLRPRWTPGLTVGLARAVYRPVDGWGGVPGALFDILPGVGGVDGPASGDPLRNPGADQVSSLFARWVFPGDGLEVYGEWARREDPESVRDALLMPAHSQGYTLGTQYARAVSGGEKVFRLQAEVTFLEFAATVNQRPLDTWYTSRGVAQGYTQRGQVIGAAIGPGASSQWIAADLMGRPWSLGLFFGRIRWDNDAMFRARQDPLPFGHDVSLLGGLRGSLVLGPVEIGAEYTGQTRYNYLFQFLTTEFSDPLGMDLRNHTLRLSVTPRLGP